eukprot:CAMPEP_0182860628 /NCGR_PEP_ID=MMETSP0034_2-20130328/5029_1 /TAXON_ID=156128 /ORGANISM="Nephroselmis pyriformis, Strain CCMP717" /LENGTH=56 /DNA_ID=CAMNT_0024992447 /DNA_START=47 /DNA_END=214 /DNA_ORIENTATION=-
MNLLPPVPISPYNSDSTEVSAIPAHKMCPLRAGAGRGALGSPPGAAGGAVRPSGLA